MAHDFVSATAADADFPDPSRPVSRPPLGIRRAAVVAAVCGAAVLSGCGHPATPVSPASGSANQADNSGSGLNLAQAVHELCGARPGDGLHGDAHLFVRQSAADAIVEDSAASLAQTDPGVTIGQFRAALLAGKANIYRENPSGSLAHIDGVPVEGPSRISATTVLPANSEVDFFFTCGAADIITN